VHTAAAKNSAKKVPIKRTTWRNRQATPSSDRYREIQNVLAAKGYLPAGAATGAWDQACADALKKFQSEQNLDSNGKINSLSLIALGLGPRHESNSTRTAEGGNNNPPDPTSR
jgi:peptidoglycan hydrolase-like protein with peptidoglycan-binding domain